MSSGRGSKKDSRSCRPIGRYRSLEGAKLNDQGQIFSCDLIVGICRLGAVFSYLPRHVDGSFLSGKNLKDLKIVTTREEFM